MKVGEILVVGSSGTSHPNILHAVCDQVMKSDQEILFGKLGIGPELTLFLYAITSNRNKATIAWDLIARKMIGSIIVFDWNNTESFENAKHNLSLFNRKFDAPCILAADVKNNPLPVNPKIVNPFVSLSPKEKFKFFNGRNPKSIKSLLISLTDVISAYAYQDEIV